MLVIVTSVIMLFLYQLDGDSTVTLINKRGELLNTVLYMICLLYTSCACLKKPEIREMFVKHGVFTEAEIDTPAHSLALTKVRPDLRAGTYGRDNDHLNLVTKYDELSLIHILQ